MKTRIKNFKPAADDWKVGLEHPQAEPAVRVHRVVPENTKFNLLLAHVRGVGGAVRVLVHPVPEPKVGSAGRMVANNSVVGVGHPVCGCREINLVLSMCLKKIRFVFVVWIIY